MYHMSDDQTDVIGPGHNKFVDPWDCEACNPEGLSKALYIASFEREPAVPVEPEPPAPKRIGVVEESGGGHVLVLVDRDLDFYPETGTAVYA